MLIYIDKSIKDALQRNDDTKKINEIFYDMSVSQRKNRHIIYGDPITISDLSIYYKGKSSDLYSFFCGLEKIINNWYVYLNTILRPIFYARVLFDDYTENARYDNHIDINIKKLDKKNDLFENATVLLPENPVDAEFYKIVSDYYVQKLPQSYHLDEFPSLECIFDDTRNGGGSVIKKCYEGFAKKANSFCIAIADNDCKYSGYIPGKDTTYMGIIEIDVKYHNPFNCNYMIIGVRDIENLIPFEIIQEIANKKVFDRIFCAIKNNEINKECIIRYFDYKNGITGKIKNNKIQHSAEKKRELEYWKAVFNSDYLDNYDTNNETIIYVYGFGYGLRDKVLEESIKVIKKKNGAIKLNSVLLEREWEKIGKFIFSYCCTLNPISVNNQFPNY